MCERACWMVTFPFPCFSNPGQYFVTKSSYLQNLVQKGKGDSLHSSSIDEHGHTGSGHRFRRRECDLDGVLLPHPGRCPVRVAAPQVDHLFSFDPYGQRTSL